jgi:xanthine dehydrogenase accessory factor
VQNSSQNLWHKIGVVLEERQPLVIATIVRHKGSVPRHTGTKMLVYQDGHTEGTIGGGLFESLVVQDALSALKVQRSETRTYSFNPHGTNPHSFGAICGGEVEIFLEVLSVPNRLIIVGGGHCGHALAKLASNLDFYITVVDDRPEYARPEDFPYPNIEAVVHLPNDLKGFPQIDSSTYVVLIGKGFDTDQTALRYVLRSSAAYIGMIGSKRKQGVVFNNLRAEGFSNEELKRVYSPIGLEIGAESPEEIAISILAQIIQIKNGCK